MPRAPRFAQRTAAVGPSIFERFLPLLRDPSRPPTKLHIGDSSEPPAAALPLTEEFRDAHPHWFQYPHTRGTRGMRAEIARYHTERHDLPTAADDILVTCGATQALSVITQAVVDPGDEVLVLTPSWPFFRGMVRLAGGIVRELPFYTEFDDAASVTAVLEATITPTTVAIYVNSPSNPSAVVLDESIREAIAAVASRHSLWLIGDEAYDGLAFDGRDPAPFASVRGAPEHTLGVYTFSKIHRFAGLRLGWMRAHRSILDVFDRVLVHQVYSASAMAQEMMIEPLHTYAQWAPTVRDELQHRRDAFVAALDLPVDTPQGTYFCFFDARPWLSAERDHDALIRALLGQGIAVAVGGDFGADYASWVRLCFAADTDDRCVSAARRLRRILEG